MAAPGHFFGAFSLFDRELAPIHVSALASTKKPGIRAGLSFIGEPSVRSGGLFLHHRVVVLALGGLGTATRSLGQRRFDLLDRFGLGNALHDRNLA